MSPLILTGLSRFIVPPIITPAMDCQPKMWAEDRDRESLVL